MGCKPTSQIATLTAVDVASILIITITQVNGIQICNVETANVETANVDKASCVKQCRNFHFAMSSLSNLRNQIN